MTKNNKVKKLLITLILLMAAVMLKSTFVQAESFFISNYNTNGDGLYWSKKYYCINYGKSFYGGYYQLDSSCTINSDNPSQRNRALSYILYHGYTSGEGGYNQYSKYQIAVWKWVHFGDPGTYAYPYTNCETKLPINDGGLYEEAMNIASVPYINPTSASITSTSSTITMYGQTGTIKLMNLCGDVSSIDIEWKNPTDNKIYSKTLKAGESEINDWIVFYSDSKCTKELKTTDFSTNKTFYVKNLKEDYLLASITIHTKAKASGYSVTFKTWENVYDWGQQMLISAEVKEGTDTEAQLKFNIEYAYGKIKLQKQGQYKLDGEDKTETVPATFKIYCKNLKKWVSGDAQGYKVYVDDIKDASTYKSDATVSKLFSTYEYQVAEVSVENNYYNNPIEMTAATSNLQKDLTIGKINDYSAATGVIIYDNKTNTVTIKDNRTSGDIVVYKVDSKYNTVKLKGTKIKVYLKDTGWLVKNQDGTYKYDGSAKDATEFETDENGEAKIACVKLGTYYFYESQAPEGYDITKQAGYQNANGKDPYSFSKDNNWAYLGTINLGKGNNTVKFTAVNKKIMDSLEGRVWIDNPDTKENKTDNIYDSSSNDKLKEGITVNLYNGKGSLLATTKTDANGEYKFTTKNASSETDKNIYYWDLADAYVEFMYNNKTYVSVDPFVGTNAKINSKAQAYTITTQELDDNNLTGDTGENPGRAITNKDAGITDAKTLLDKNKDIWEKIKNNTASETDLKNVPLACYYDNTTFKVTDINLGLLEKHDPTYSVDENLAYIKVKMKGYTYTYKYGEDAVTDSQYVPTVQEQNSSKTFTGKIYPTDIAYNAEESTATDKLQVYVVYSIDVTNTDTTYVDNVYYEQRLYLDSLTNSFDTERYTLCTNENNEDKTDFALWKDSGNGTATYDVNAENSVYKNGIGSGEKANKATSYIQFKIKEDAVQRLLQNDISKDEKENVPTKTTVSAYHEYLRTDNAWNHDKNVRAFGGVKGLNTYPTESTKNNKKYYVHKTVSKEHQAADLYLKLSLGETRKVSGTVFEDTKTSQSESENTNIGNGMIDETENNRASGVTVELLNQDKSTTATLYQVKDNKEETATAKVISAEDGTFTFDGVVPGYYYIRFTYGDGTQKMMPASDVIKSNDYKSTIINTNEAGTFIKDAMEEENPIAKIGSTLPGEYTEEQKKLVEWYKYLNNTTYSTATDDLTQRAQADGYTYTDGKIYDKDGKEVSGYMDIYAYTPMVGISIENDINNSTNVKGSGDAIEEVQKSNYSGFNFGIIKNASTNLILDKKITNVKFTTQTGTTLVSANPTDKTANYITALDKVTGGSKYAKLEIEKDLIYGSELATTYEVSITNDSTKDYIEDEEVNGKKNTTYGYYAKYGDKSNAHLKKITVVEVVDTMDAKYTFDSKQDSSSQIITDEEGNTTESEKVKIVKNNDATENSLTITNWTPIASQEKTTTNYTVTSLVSSENDETSYSNEAKITKIKLANLSTLESDFDWTKLKDPTELAIIPPTGGNRSNLYWIVGTIGLIVIAGGIVIIKRKLLNK